MQKTALLLAYTKKSTTLCFQVLIIRSVRVVCKLHHVFLAKFWLLFSHFSVENSRKFSSKLLILVKKT